MFILFLTSPDGRGNPFYCFNEKPFDYAQGDKAIKRLQRTAGNSSKKNTVSKKCKCYRKMGEDFSQLSFPDLGQNVAPSLRLKGC
jgi:hypothetical protein